MKAKVLLAACAAALVLAACNAASPTAPSSGVHRRPSADGLGTMGSGGYSDTTKHEGSH
jgi:hypothetical protein